METEEREKRERIIRKDMGEEDEDEDDEGEDEDEDEE